MKNSFPLFTIVTLLVIAAAWYSTSLRAPDNVVEKTPLFPELSEKINDVAKMEIKTHDSSAVLSIKEGKWGIENRDHYPAFFTQIKPLVIAMSELEILEGKTANPEMYPRLNVEDPDIEKAKSKQITLKDAEGNQIVSLIVGKDRVNRADGRVDSLYVRRAEDEQSFLVKGRIFASAKPMDWLENSLFSLPSDQLRSINIEHSGDNTVIASRANIDATNFKLENIPQGYKIKSQTIINSLAVAVEELRFEDVNSSDSFSWPTDTIQAEYETFDGLIVKVKSAKIDNTTWAAFTFSADPNAEKPAIAEEGSDEENKIPTLEERVSQLNQKFNSWVYALPDFKADMMRKSKETLISDKEQPAERSGESAPMGEPSFMPMQLPPQ